MRHDRRDAPRPADGDPAGARVDRARHHDRGARPEPGAGAVSEARIAQPLDLRGRFTVAAPVLGLVLVIALFALDPDVRPYFFTWRNCVLILSQTAVIG